MPLVLQRSNNRPEDAALLAMRDTVAARHRSTRLTYLSNKAQVIENKQKAAYERTTKRPFLPRPKAESGYSAPEWDVPRSSWLAYCTSDTSKWRVWDAADEKWLEIEEYDKTAPPSPDQPKIESPDALGASVPQRSNSDPLPRRSRLTFRAVAQSIMKVLTLQRGNSSET